MEGLTSNFEHVLKHFEEHLQGAMYAAVDMELTGTSIEHMPESYEDSVPERLSKLCQVAESHAPIQIGITLVRHSSNCFNCTSYNFYVFPWIGPELLGREPSFLCKAAALQFNADKNHIDFNKWLKHAVPYMSREDEAQYLANPVSHGDTDLPRKVGLLRVWKLLCQSRVPLVTHCPLDIFFLLTCFERRQFPRDPKEIARVILECLPLVFDTAHLHGAIGSFKSLQLVRFLEEAKIRHSELVAANACLPCFFPLSEETALRYGAGELAHDAGFDSLCTAKLYAYLLNISPEIVEKSANRFFLFKSTECLDLRSAADGGDLGYNIFNVNGEYVIVARLYKPRDSWAVRQISNAGFVYKWVNSFHVLVSINSPGHTMASLIAELQSLVPDVEWMSFEDWKSNARYCECALISTSHEQVQFQRCSQVQRWLDGVDGFLYSGTVTRFHASGGYGFIKCREALAKFGVDVFVHSAEMDGISVGQKVSFAVHLNSRGQPQAKNVRPADASSWLASKPHCCDRDADEGRTTTTRASSDCASTSDLDSLKDGSSRGSDSQHTLASLMWLEGAVPCA